MMIYLRVLSLQDGNFELVLIELAPWSRKLLLLLTLKQGEGSFELGAFHTVTNASMLATWVWVLFSFSCEIGRKRMKKGIVALSPSTLPINFSLPLELFLLQVI